MDLYHRPQNLFVAEFIGSPKMNVLPGRLLAAEADHAQVAVHGETVRVAVDARRAAPGAAVAVGIRPEHLLAGEQGPGAPLRLRLRQVERLGDSSLLYLALAAGAPMLTLRLEGAAAHTPGEHISVRLRPEHCHLFDAAGQAFARSVELPV
jgi:multiple sugar transport system ATP-binding protein